MAPMEPLFGQSRPLIGVLHLLPLPGSPFEGPGLSAVLDRALGDAEVLAKAGAHGVIVENIGDAPFARSSVEPHVVSMMAIVARAVQQRFGDVLVLGTNVLRNDSKAALAVAAAADARFVRINVHVGAMLTDQGVIEGQARETLLYRNRVAPGVQIAADVLVKHAVPLAPLDPVQVARDTLERGGADALILTGSGTGAETELGLLRGLRDALPEASLWIGSGLTAENAANYAPWASAAIVGTALHQEGNLEAPLCIERTKAIVEAFCGP
ncbi:MAG: BtpA/SgcQ family protein [Myxococcota bacterium]|nr:BtpA/SgcQ family protein [Myxococcota bacterium]